MPGHWSRPFVFELCILLALHQYLTAHTAPANADSEMMTILEPQDSSTVELSQDGMLNIQLVLPQHVEIPLHGIVLISVDEEVRAALCPDLVQDVKSCPTRAGDWSGGEISFRLSNFSFGQHILFVEIVDITGNTLYNANSIFTVIPYSPWDEELTNPGFNIIIFSKDRACQLDQLLSSMSQFIPNMESSDVKVQVLYHHSDSDFREGYDVVRKFHPRVHFHQQHNLSATTSSAYFDLYLSSQGSPDTFKVPSRLPPCPCLLS
jgi:hypothetical protein